MGNTCKPMAVSFQCMTKFTTKKKKKKKKNLVSHNMNLINFIETNQGAYYNSKQLFFLTFEIIVLVPNNQLICEFL